MEAPAHGEQRRSGRLSDDRRANLPREVVERLRAVVGDRQAALHEPRFDGNELAYLTECIETTLVSSVGPFVERFEADLAALTGARRAVAVVNGTAALQIALMLAGVERGDEVVVPALTFVATANAVAHCGAIPHFADIDERRLGLDHEALRAHLRANAERRGGVCINRETERVIRAVVPMHAFGHPVDMDGLLSVASEFGLVVVEDAAESLGSYYRGRHTGVFGRLGALSFNGNKIVTTGGGGAILTNDESLGRRAKHLTTQAKVPHRWEYRHDEIGYNYRLPNLNAALGCAQLEQLPRLLEAKRELFRRYDRAFADVAGVRLVREPEGSTSNYWLQALLLERADFAMRDAVLAATNDAGLGTRPAWTLMHELPHFSACPRMPLTVAENVEARLINLPSSAHLAATQPGHAPRAAAHSAG